MKQKHKLWIRSIIIALSSFLITTVLYLSDTFTVFENKTYDLRMSNAVKYKSPCEDIIFIKVDQESINYGNSEKKWGWPWPREAYANLIDILSSANPKAITFDIIYSEPSVFGENDDIALGDAEARSKKVVQTFFYSDQDYDEPLYPVPAIRNNAAILGNITSSKDSDDIIRRTRIIDSYNGQQIPSLGFAGLYISDENPDLSSIPMLDDGTALLRYTDIDSYNSYSASDILACYDDWKEDPESFDLSEFEGKYIFCAYYAPGLFDICSTPVSQVYPGVGVHITALDNYLTDSFVVKTDNSIIIPWLFIVSLLAAIIIALSENFFPRYSGIIIPAGLASGMILLIALPVYLLNCGIWFQLVSPLVAFFISSIASIIFSLSVEGKQKRFIRSAFSQCLSKDVVNQIINDTSSFTLGGKKFQMSAIFTDIQSFSSFSELLSASQLGCLLNYYLTKMSDIIISEKGTVDKYEGDAIVALVGAPVSMTDHAKHACSAAVKMKAAEIQMNKEIIEFASNPKPSWMEDDLYNAFKILIANNKTIFTRIGINSGEMIAGYFGSELKKNYTMMGNNVNLASRLEGVNKQYHTNGILISQATKELLDDDFAVRSLDRVRVVNINTPIQLYEVLAEKKDASQDLLSYIDNWEDAMAAFNDRNYGDAKTKFQQLLSLNKDDGVAEYYIHLLDDYFLQNKYPVEADNEGVEYNTADGVFKLLHK